jgi:hypothetical protein
MIGDGQRRADRVVRKEPWNSGMKTSVSLVDDFFILGGEILGDPRFDASGCSMATFTPPGRL